MVAKPKTIYLAGPEVFLPDAIEVGSRKKALCAARGLTGLFPFDNEVIEGTGEIDRVIYRANVEMIRAADFGIFNLTPFRGPSADVGTVFELGMMTGLGKPCFGYSNVEAPLIERVRAADNGCHHAPGGAWLDSAGMSIEDFGNADNLMVDGALEEGGVALWRVSVGAADDLFRNLTGFSACLDALEEHLAAMSGNFRASA